jgi:hypothetical protein
MIKFYKNKKAFDQEKNLLIYWGSDNMMIANTCLYSGRIYWSFAENLYACSVNDLTNSDKKIVFQYLLEQH